MPSFSYKAVDATGKRVHGFQNAADHSQLVALLHSKNLYLLEAQERGYENDAKYKLKPREVTEFCRRIGVMMSAGIPLIRILRMLSEGNIKPQLRTIYTNITSLVQTGTALSDAMEHQGNAFPGILINMFRIGEMSVSLPKNAQRMAEHFEKESRMHGRIKSASSYPIFLFIVTIIVTLLIFVFILPEFFTMFEGQELPGVTQMILNISRFLTRNSAAVIVGIIAFAAAVVILRQVDSVKYRYHRLILRIPKISGLLKTIYTSRFARTLSSLYASGMSITTALENLGDVIGNLYIKAQLVPLVARVRNGEMLSEAIRAVDGFSDQLYVTLSVGEESGQLDRVLSDIADTFDYDADQAISRIVSLLGPAMIIIMAIIVGTVMISVFLPLIQLYQTYQSM